MDNRHMKKMVVGAAVFTVLSVSVMLQRSATKHIVITDAAEIRSEQGNAREAYEVMLDRNVVPGKEGVLTIPLARNVRSDDIVLEDRYIDHELRIYIKSREDDFYMDHPVVTDLKNVLSAGCICEDDSGRVCLDFKLDGLYGNESLMTDQGTIEVTFFDPKDRYNRIVVVDPIGGGSELGNTGSGMNEKDIALLVAKELKSIAEKDVGVRTKLYFTRLDDEDVDLDKRAAFISETGANLFLRLGAGASQDTGKCGVLTEYNDSFFLRGLNNAEFADVLEKNCVTMMNCNAAGCQPTEDQALAGIRIPAAKVNLCYVTNESDAAGMAQTSYAKKAAEGIYRGILEAFKEME